MHSLYHASVHTNSKLGLALSTDISNLTLVLVASLDSTEILVGLTT